MILYQANMSLNRNCTLKSFSFLKIYKQLYLLWKIIMLMIFTVNMTELV